MCNYVTRQDMKTVLKDMDELDWDGKPAASKVDDLAMEVEDLKKGAIVAECEMQRLRKRVGELIMQSDDAHDAALELVEKLLKLLPYFENKLLRKTVKKLLTKTNDKLNLVRKV